MTSDFDKPEEDGSAEVIGELDGLEVAIGSGFLV
jgi:hypothetical protein